MRSTLLKTQYQRKLQPSKNDPPPRGTFGGRKGFLSEFCKLTKYSESIWGAHHEKHKSIENFNHGKNETARGDHAAFGGRKRQSEFCKLTIYSASLWGPHHEKHKIRENFNHRIQLVYEEYIIKASNFNIRKISRVRVPIWFQGHFFASRKNYQPLGTCSRSHFYGTIKGAAPSVYSIYQLAKLSLKGSSPGPYPVLPQQNWTERPPG